MLKLHLGCGPHIKPGWENLDLQPGNGGKQADLTKPLPYLKDSVSYIFSEHFIEHISREQGVKMLKECFRVLKPGGVLRISTPNLEVLVLDYLDNKLTRWGSVWLPNTRAQLINEGMRSWGHQFLYDIEELTLVLEEAGFQQVNIVSYMKSNDNALSDQEVRPYHEDIIMEAKKHGSHQ